MIQIEVARFFASKSVTWSERNVEGESAFAFGLSRLSVVVREGVMSVRDMTLEELVIDGDVSPEDGYD